MNRAQKIGLVACVLATAVLGGASARSAAQSGLREIDRLREFTFGADRSILDAAAEVVHASLASRERRGEVADALAWVALSKAAFDARQFACRQLVYVATPEQIPAMIRLLGHSTMAHYGLMVLDRIPGAEVGSALRRELPKLRGAALIGALDLLGERGEAASAAPLARAAADPDAAVAGAAVTALAKLGQAESDRALLALLSGSTGARRRAVSDALILRAQSLLKAGKHADAVRLVAPLRARTAAAPVRSAAMRITALAKGEAGLLDVLAALQSSEREVAHMAAQVCREMRGSAVTRRLASALPGLPSRAKTLVIDALADRGDPSAENGLMRMAADADPDVRRRALAALGMVGTSASVTTLLKAASSGSPADRTVAATALARLRGADVDARLMKALDDPTPQVRAQALNAAFARGASIPEDRLVRMAVSDHGEARMAGLTLLREIGTIAAAPPLLESFAKASEDDRDSIMGALTAIARREPSAIATVIAALERTQDPAQRVALLTCLGEIGGAEALRVLMGAASDTDADEQLAALRALAEWPTTEPMAVLRTIAGNPPNPRARAVALRGYLRMLRLPGAAPLKEATALYRQALDLARSDDEKRLVLSGLSTVGSRDALAMARSLAGSEELRAEAELAILTIAHMTAGAWPAETRDALGHLSANAGDDEIRQKAAMLLATMDRFGDFAMTWEVSPAYEREAASFSALFDLEFPPETGAGDAEVGWRVMPVGTAPEQPWLLDLLALYGGEQKVAYLRTALWSETEQDLTIEVGTDDGPKLWWNGEVVLANNTQRAVAPNQDRATVRAKAGWNTVLLKVTQNVMGWAACVRFADAGGQPAKGIRLALPSFRE